MEIVLDTSIGNSIQYQIKHETPTKQIELKTNQIS